MSRAYADSTLVRVAGPDAFEPALRRFLKACRETGVFTELKKREAYASPSVRRRVKSQKAAQRRARASRRRPETGPLEDWKPAPAPRA